MRAVELIHEDLAERLTASLPSFLRTNLRPRVVHTEQGRFHDFLKDLPPSSLFHIITLAPLPGQMVMTISPDVSYTILELRLGGRSERRQHDRGLTEIDQLLLRGMVEHMLNDFKAAWNRLVVVEPGLDDSTVNYHWVQMVMGNERVMLVAFEVTVQSVTGTMNVYIPFTMLKPIATLLNPHIFIAGQKEKEGSQSEQRTAVENLSAVTIPTRVLLGSASIPFGSLVDIQPGEIIKLDRGIHQEVMIQVADRVRFTGRVGKNGEHLAVQITGLVDQK
jgi:flagellar motor switch protein FliM